MADAEDRTEAPSGRRLEKAREDGDVFLSRELLMFVGLGAGIVAVLYLLPRFVVAAVATLREFLAHAGDDSLSLTGAVIAAVRAFLWVALPVSLCAMTATWVAGFAQTRLLLRPAGLMPDFGRLSPMKGLTRVFGFSGVLEGFKAALKAAALAAVVAIEARRVVRDGAALVGYPVGPLSALFLRGFARLSITFLLAYGAITALDAVLRYRKRLSKLRMSRQELKDEYKEMEGDPHVKGKIRQIRMRMARQQMLKAVKSATVVVTNPTHYAVALVYERGTQGAPRIVAKGTDHLAARIRQIAQENRVPVVPNPPLARALYPLPLDTEVPMEHFRVVAGIIAHVWRIKRANGTSTRH